MTHHHFNFHRFLTGLAFLALLVTNASGSQTIQEIPGSEPEIEKLDARAIARLPDLPDLTHSSNKSSKEYLLFGRSPVELKIMRNTIFARHGQSFQTRWLQDYFNSRPGNIPWINLSKKIDFSIGSFKSSLY